MKNFKPLTVSVMQRGFSLAWLLAGVSALAMLAVMGSNVYSTIIAGNQRSSLLIAGGQQLTQAAYTLTTEITYNAAGLPLAASAFTATPAPVGGGQLPVASAAPRTDPWGMPLGYCAASASQQGDPVFAVLSAGPDKVFNTSCAQALLGQVQGDDGLRFKTVANIKQGVGGTVYFGDPVALPEDLGNLTLVKPGEMRVVKSDASLWVNQTGVPGFANWVRATSAGGGGFALVGDAIAGEVCSANGEGALARDRSSGELLVCEESTRTGFEEIDCGTGVGRMTVDSIRRLYVCG